MTPSARIQAAIEVLDRIRDGMPAEKALTTWARASRFAGSSDRAAVRDHVFDVLRRRSSYAALGGGEGGRALMLGSMRAAGLDPADFFTGARHAPDALSAAEFRAGSAPEGVDALDIPSWQLPLFERAFADQAPSVAERLKSRAPVFVRANLLRGTPEQAMVRLAGEGIIGRPHPRSETALEVIEGARKVAGSRTFAEGWVELQDVSSQAVVADLPEPAGDVLDYCAGGGGKALAMAARFRREVAVWDRNPGRMSDIPLRARRAGAVINILAAPPSGRDWSLVLCDVPCSGSGAWRRSPGGKWSLTQQRLSELRNTQAEVLSAASALVASGGVLAYVTCSLFCEENEDQVAAFLDSHPDWTIAFERRYRLDEGGDGFYAAHLTRA